jgi:glycosyltransferase involved in cell wall biosynthesis
VIDSLGFACQWGSNRGAAWSGTPLRLLTALSHQLPVVDLDVTVSPRIQPVLKAASARRTASGWQSKWKHSRSARYLVERNLRRVVGRADPRVVLEIQDLGIVDRPYAVLQDLSYDLLLDHFGDTGVPHFRTLTRDRIRQLRDRQVSVYNEAATLLPMSRWLADRTAGSGIAADRIHVVNPGVNAPLDPTAPLVERRAGETRRLLFIGRDFETKAGDQVVAAFSLLRQRLGDQITLTIAGPKQWPLAEAPADGITFMGPVPVAAVQSLYDTHDLFVMPSRFEGFGIAFVEALVRGLPCVGRDACAMPEIITPGDGGVLIASEDPGELADAVLNALADDALYAACAEAAGRRREHYTWERAAREIISALPLDH